MECCSYSVLSMTHRVSVLNAQYRTQATVSKPNLEIVQKGHESQSVHCSMRARSAADAANMSSYKVAQIPAYELAPIAHATLVSPQSTTYPPIVLPKAKENIPVPFPVRFKALAKSRIQYYWGREAVGTSYGPDNAHSSSVNACRASFQSR
jgi:hypothetical protein